ncbi:MAG: Bax inhibitor-1 family protein [Lachnospiraceae bacterium]|nr:Bax inhibitor-1 family protein [Lachnospiraceae bacterium]
MSFEVENKRKKESSLQLFDRSDRMFATGGEISAARYNLVMGLYICIGFLINFAMAYFLKDIILSIHPIAVMIAYFVLTLGGAIITHKSTSPFVSTVSFLIMSVGMGLLLTYFLTMYEVSMVYTAFGITIGIAAVMTVIAVVKPELFAGIGSGLGIALIVTVAAELICGLFFRRYFMAFDYIIIAIFCGYIGYDVARAQTYVKTMQTAIMCAADLYMDLVNVFIRILSIMGKSKK